MKNILLLLVLSLLISLVYFFKFASATNIVSQPITEPISISHLKEYAKYPSPVKKLIKIALSLSEKQLTYLYGSADPINKGMDCSGTINYILKQAKVNNVPRQANKMYLWVEKKGKLHQITGHDFNSPEFSNLKPGDLLFWSGTYDVHRDPPITHVMIYLGVNEKNKPLMFGASDGRTYDGKRMRGVSIFDFKLPNDQSKEKFVAYGCVPGLTCEPSAI